MVPPAATHSTSSPGLMPNGSAIALGMVTCSLLVTRDMILTVVRNGSLSSFLRRGRTSPSISPTRPPCERWRCQENGSSTGMPIGVKAPALRVTAVSPCPSADGGSSHRRRSVPSPSEPDRPGERSTDPDDERRQDRHAGDDADEVDLRFRLLLLHIACPPPGIKGRCLSRVHCRGDRRALCVVAGTTWFRHPTDLW